MKCYLFNEKIKTFSGATVILGKEINFKDYLSDDKQIEYVKSQFDKGKDIAEINLYYAQLYFINFEDKDNLISNKKEKIRVAGSKSASVFNADKTESVTIVDANSDFDLLYLFTEGMLLGNYKFALYYKDREKKEHSLKTLKIYSSLPDESKLKELENIVDAVFIARDYANEPFSNLNALQFSERLKDLANKTGMSFKVLSKKEIEEEQMGGLLAVNKGSAFPPTFNILEYKHENAVNEKPYVLVGKGIVFDSGGYSIKPTKNSMDIMKLDMAGAAAAAGIMYAVAENKLPVNLIALIPATDNAVDAKSYVPGDIIKMHNGLFVEVLNTDAEGRLILADALSYAEKYNPELVVDLATLTGAAAYCIGTQAAVVTGTADDKMFEMLEKSGENVYERVVRFPFWDEYKEMLKSNTADIKNIGGSEAGAVTAGKFLEYFTDYPWIHVDIAGPAILNKKNAYRTEGGSGYGVRLLYDFFKNMIQEKENGK
ncbi:MAG: leucyl aminopeptidase [Chlorobi bacterium]|nr:leucyl aminopeptidase [Chlorobiota bacterium]